ncbi:MULTISPECIES: 3-phosphoshikimate 1-carboxyvinyltransferase [Mesonia]|uniref:3-phosphoshikimate 1-carboxyvinyltransferase n=1 Tax=Mesonia oceanica TaxID=2687242 RepID=A0AC61Y9L7_9FLAO|nr:MULTISPECIES: 3-phosphoshikimate 1-carboxyvinyltransferase [Mesonia]MAN29452.1 3-phosphoshikimate 1-carboxyvinyltransferase [Mesonia sp.]MAQ42106.1 3-phosphoshikimate 1-carboxyvinyltransferase [Mesonia sp.]MBJ97070.1 3-phosphoshikimate 1-carboxyvinyltransferase [Flavobacteriaceae bacterium]VVV00578.1 3-phosphoshikimate 1-carboxyvinyltransferase [Mesonia oceanica]|tara:strand:- start:14602 stop:15828 length:1227 start_codon:yes stop_codon:yes gene_type:complete
MNIRLSAKSKNIAGKWQVTGSKSETNRLLILQALFPQIEIENSSNSDDSQVLQKALSSQEGLIDIHHAGTAMRFLTAYFSVQEGQNTILTGSKRMQERPIKLLVDALRNLGAEIKYQQEEGYPPLEITGKKLIKDKVRLAANVSSQYISALMLIAPSLEKGLEIQLQGKITSTPYILMTLSLLKELGINASLEENIIKIAPFQLQQQKKFVVESDWSSASYFYSLVALSDSAKIEISSYKKESLQGDSSLVKLYESLGVKTTFLENSIQLEKDNSVELPKIYRADLTSSPDLAQTIVVSCLGLGIGCELIGLHTLKIKETDRLVALYDELTKFGAHVDITNDSLKLYPCVRLTENVLVATYNDHRMAMAFAPLALKTNLQIEDAGVVSKSFPDFWEAIENFQIQVEKV